MKSKTMKQWNAGFTAILFIMTSLQSLAIANTPVQDEIFSTQPEKAFDPNAIEEVNPRIKTGFEPGPLSSVEELSPTYNPVISPSTTTTKVNGEDLTVELFDSDNDGSADSMKMIYNGQTREGQFERSENGIDADFGFWLLSIPPHGSSWQVHMEEVGNGKYKLSTFTIKTASGYGGPESQEFYSFTHRGSRILLEYFAKTSYTPILVNDIKYTDTETILHLNVRDEMEKKSPALL